MFGLDVVQLCKATNEAFTMEMAAFFQAYLSLEGRLDDVEAARRMLPAKKHARRAATAAQAALATLSLAAAAGASKCRGRHEQTTLRTRMSYLSRRQVPGRDNAKPGRRLQGLVVGQKSCRQANLHLDCHSCH